MSWYTMLVIAIGLSADTFAISVAKGVATKASRLLGNLRLAFLFAIIAVSFFGLGLMVSGLMSSSWLRHVQDGLSVALFVIGLQMVVSAVVLEGREVPCADAQVTLSGIRLFALMLAANLDVAAVGAIIPLKDQPIANGLTVGVVTFAASLLGLSLGDRMSQIARHSAQLVGGAGLLTSSCVRIFS